MSPRGPIRAGTDGVRAWPAPDGGANRTDVPSTVRPDPARSLGEARESGGDAARGAPDGAARGRPPLYLVPPPAAA
jgi:hypothetical protein